jgi:hypothetical protein
LPAFQDPAAHRPGQQIASAAYAESRAELEHLQTAAERHGASVSRSYSAIDSPTRDGLHRVA